jgi:hypothetical protein
MHGLLDLQHSHGLGWFALDSMARVRCALILSDILPHTMAMVSLTQWMRVVAPEDLI